MVIASLDKVLERILLTPILPSKSENLEKNPRIRGGELWMVPLKSKVKKCGISKIKVTILSSLSKIFGFSGQIRPVEPKNHKSGVKLTDG